MTTEVKPAATVKNLRLEFVQKKVLQGIDWVVPSGKITTLIGPNGCGKSTL